MNNLISHEDLLKHLRYVPETGEFFWIKRVRGIKLGMKAGSFDVYGYGQLRIFGRLYKEHRLVWYYVTGRYPDGQIDHINHDRRDNRFENLRTVNNSLNHMNRPIQKNNTSGHVGVCYRKRVGKYEAYISVSGSRKNLGLFESIDKAIECRKKANEMYGYSPNHGNGVGVSKPRKAEYKEKLKLLKGSA